jgi:hypothetical protein
MSKPISDNSHVDACGYQLDSNAMSKRVGPHPFFRERWYLLGGCLNILPEFKSHTRRTERLAITIHEDRFIVSTGLSSQQCAEQIHRFRPQWADSGFPAFSKELHVGRRLEPNCVRTHIQGFLDASFRVVEESE